jgi:hypothetical protein
MRIPKTAGTPVPKRAKAAQCAITAAVRRLVVERGHLGVTNKLLQHEALTCSNRAGTVLAKLTHTGEIHGAQVVGVPKHWFASAELAQRWLAITPPQPKATPTPRQQIVPLHRHRSPMVTLGKRASNVDTPANVPAGLKVQRGPSQTHDARYQCAPGEQPYGAGFAAAGVGRDVTTGTAWGQQA